MFPSHDRGSSHTISGNADISQIYGGSTHTINGTALNSVIVGGNTNQVENGLQSGILAGTGSYVSHNRSVVIGGQGLS